MIGHPTRVDARAAISTISDTAAFISSTLSTLDKESRLPIHRDARFIVRKPTHLFLWQSVNIYGVSKRLSWTPPPDASDGGSSEDASGRRAGRSYASAATIARTGPN